MLDKEKNIISKISEIYLRLLTIMVYIMLSLAGIGILIMIGVTCADVFLRRSQFAFVGAYDIVKIAGALTLAMALPYTTAVKGHVAIEYFFHKFNRKARLVIDTFCRIFGVMLFMFLSIRCFIYGNQLYKIGQVSQTLQLPIFWVLHVIGICCFAVVLVVIYHLTHPNREMIKP